ncbi:MAG TPA: PilN domain-containing protein [Verrucomicrobiae bacterium]|nr:PilN domain-containing protein [Verrucomicrobiae bacterium]
MASDVNKGGGSRTVAALAARFFGWWFGELRACIPPVLRRLVAGRRRRLYLLLRDDVTDFYEESAGKPRVLASLEQDAPDAAARVLLQRLQDKGPWAEILAVIPAERALRRRLQLPLAVAENLRESVGFDIDRLTPFRAEEVVYQARIAGIDRQRGQVVCDLTVVPRATVDAALKRAGLLGIRPDRVAVEPEEAGTASPAETAAAPIYLPVALGGRVDRWLPWRLPAALAGLVLLLAAAGLYLHFDRSDAVLAAYAGETAKYRKAADAAAKLREQVQTLARTRAAAATQREALPLMVDVLAELTARLPDDTWLTDLRLSDAHMQLSGYASSAATLVPVIENSPMFQGARLSGPVLPDASMQRERFSIEADLTPKAGS